MKREEKSKLTIPSNLLGFQNKKKNGVLWQLQLNIKEEILLY